jgi:hypothetical protein
MRREGLDKLIKIIHHIGSRTHNLLVCNIAPQVYMFLIRHLELLVLNIKLNVSTIAILNQFTVPEFLR